METTDARSRARRRAVGATAVAVATLVLTGCATMPDSGSIPAGPADATGTSQNTRVQLIAVPPKDNEQPDSLLRGFLDDLASDEADYATAQRYLTPAADSTWKPQERVTILDSVGQSETVTSSDGRTITVTVTGTAIAYLDAHGSYQPGSNQPANLDYHFAKNSKGQWRIDGLPPGIVINQQDFPRIFESVNLFFPAKGGFTSAGVSPLVPDPVYLRSRIDPLTTAAGRLLTGPSGGLEPVVNNNFPDGSKLELDASGEQTKVFLTLGPGGSWSDSSCQAMAAQLYTTLSQVSTTQVSGVTSPTSVALYSQRGGPVKCHADEPSTAGYRPVQSSGTAVGQQPSPATAYFLNAQHQLTSVTVSGNGSPPQPSVVPTQLVPSGVSVGSFAVSPTTPSAQQVASVTANGQALYLSAMKSASAPGSALLHSPGGGLSSPSWDGTSVLWVADTDPARPRLRAVMNGAEVPVQVQGLPQGGVIQQVRVAPDGARIALLVKNGDETSLLIGRVRRTGGGNTPSLYVEVLNRTAQNVTSIGSLAWQDGDSLVVLGQQAGTSSVISVEMDGSPSLTGTLQALNGATDVTANPGEPQQPLFATANGQIYVLQSAGRWASIGQPNTTVKGTSIRYPG